MTKIVKILFIIGLITTGFGYISRVANIYFFWDSREIGWIVLIISLILYLCSKLNLQDLYLKKTIRNLFGILFLLFLLCLSAFIIIEIKTSAPYQVAIDYLKKDNEIRNKVGDIKRFGLIPTGTTHETTINGAESGNAELHITINGKKRNLDVTVSLKILQGVGWQVSSVD